MSTRIALSILAVVALPLVVPSGAPGQEASGVRVGPPGSSDARLQGYRMSGIGLPWEGDLSLRLGRPLVLPPRIGHRVDEPDTRREGAGMDSAGPKRPRPFHPLRRSVVVVSGTDGRAHSVEVIRRDRAPPPSDTAACVRVEVHLAAGTVRTARVALSRLGAADAGEARAVLRRRMEEEGVLTLTALDGTGLSVPARLIRRLAVEPCREGY